MYPHRDLIPISQIRKGLLVNVETHTQPKQRKITQSLHDALRTLGERHERIEKDIVQGWLIQHLYMQQLEFGVFNCASKFQEARKGLNGKQSRQSEETQLKDKLTATDGDSERDSATKSESAGTTASLITFV